MVGQRNKMPVVTITQPDGKEHSFYMDGYHLANLDHLKKNVRKDYDAFILYVGKEGYGKTTIALQDAIYCDPTFNLDRVCFTIDQFVEQVEKAEKYQAIVFDETMGYLSNRQSSSKFNRILIKIMSEMRSKNLFVFLCIPSLFIMDWYVAYHRTSGMIRVHERGRFCSYDYKKKQELFMKGKKSYSYCVPANFFGKFTKYFPIDKEAYEAKKQESIKEWDKRTSTTERVVEQRDKCIKYIYIEDRLPARQVGELVGLSESQIRRIVA